MFEGLWQPSKNNTSGISHNVSLDRITGLLYSKEDLELTFSKYQIEKETRLGKFLFIIGPHEVVPNEIALLFVYPLNKFPYTIENFQRIKQFCYPIGMNPVTHKDDIIQNQFVFTLNKDGKILFGICTHFYSTNPNFLTNAMTLEPLCICTITQNPQLHQNFQFQALLAAKLAGLPVDCNFKIDAKLLGNDWTPSKEILENLNRFHPPLYNNSKDVLAASINPICMTPKFLEILNFYLRISNEQCLLLKLSQNSYININLEDDTNTQIASAVLDVLFSCLSVDSILKYFTAVLTEQQIIVYGTDMFRVSSIALAAMNLIHPVDYQGVFLPLVPNLPEYYELIGTPVPYLYGLVKTPDMMAKIKAITDPNEIVFIDVDVDNVQVPAKMPGLPLYKTLKNALNNALNKIKPVKRSKGYYEEYARHGISMHIKWTQKMKYIFLPAQTLRIQKVFHEYMEGLVGHDKLNVCRVRDTTDPDNPKVGFNNDAYLLGADPNHVDFYENFVASMAFQAYCDRTFFR